MAQDEASQLHQASTTESTDDGIESGSSGRFVRCLALDPTYSEASLRHAVNVMCSGKVAVAGKAADRLSELIDQVKFLFINLHNSASYKVLIS